MTTVRICKIRVGTDKWGEAHDYGYVIAQETMFIWKDTSFRSYKALIGNGAIRTGDFVPDSMVVDIQYL